MTLDLKKYRSGPSSTRSAARKMRRKLKKSKRAYKRSSAEEKTETWKKRGETAKAGGYGKKNKGKLANLAARKAKKWDRHANFAEKWLGKK